MLELIPNPLVIPIGFAVGVLVAAPVGPVNVLCIQRAIERGWLGGVAAGLGAVLGDGLIALFAALWVGSLTVTVTDYRSAIQIVGGAALIVFGLIMLRSKPQIAAHDGAFAWATMRDYIWDIPKTFVLTITNPAAVLGLVAIFGGVSSYVAVRSGVDAFVFVAAVMAGSLAWWLALSTLVSRLRNRVDLQGLRWINLIAGILLIGSGGLLAGELFVKRFDW